MLEGYGLHQLTWDTCDERFGDVLVASSADAGGRGITLAIRQNGAAADLIEGHGTNSWIVLDYGSVVVHVFSEEAREFYDLERLWQDGEKLTLDFD